MTAKTRATEAAFIRPLSKKSFSSPFSADQERSGGVDSAAAGIDLFLVAPLVATAPPALNGALFGLSEKTVTYFTVQVRFPCMARSQMILSANDGKLRSL